LFWRRRQREKGKTTDTCSKGGKEEDEKKLWGWNQSFEKRRKEEVCEVPGREISNVQCTTKVT
jgi:hypothetical protein